MVRRDDSEYDTLLYLSCKYGWDGFEYRYVLEYLLLGIRT
jgi:hypothetical protein